VQLSPKNTGYNCTNGAITNKLGDILLGGKKGGEKMKKLRIMSAVLAVALLIVLGTALTVVAATEEEIKTAIDNGLAWLVLQQNLDTGCWGDWDQVARTGFAVVKLEDLAFELGYSSPFDAGYAYHTNVEKGLNCIFANAYTIAISGQPAGDPDSEGDGQAIYFGSYWTRTYETGIAVMAIAASRAPSRVVAVSGSPVNGWTYKKVLQNAVDYLAFGQTDAAPGRGGWDYRENTPWNRSDNSNTGYAVLGLRYAEAPLYGFASTIPAFVKTELNIWIDYIQNDVDGDADDGGSGYSDPSGWVNLLKTGNLLFEMAFVGDTTTTARVQDAIAYIERHWNDANQDPGWQGPPPHYQAAYCMMKGFESLGINTITVGGNPVDWFAEMSTAIVANQSDDGSWPWDLWGDQMLATEWALLTLEKVTPPPPTVEGRMTGGGSVMGSKVTHGFELHCDASQGPNNLQVNWGKGNKFHLESLTSANCSDNSNIDEAPPVAGFDTYKGSGTGRYNGVSGATATWTFTDAGEPGNNDFTEIVIRDAAGNIVLSVSGNLKNGNHQAHAE
jgi:hypothetical protein